MIIPENLTLEEYIGVLKAELETHSSTAKYTSETRMADIDRGFELGAKINLLSIIKRELDGKVDR